VKRIYLNLDSLSDVIDKVLQNSNKKQNNKKIGNLGESIAAKYLENKGFTVLDRNYLKKWGEIDIVARRTIKIHFVEVKTVSYETKEALKASVSRGTWQPEQNVHEYKLKKLARAIESWLMENKYEGEWQIDVVAVKIVPREKYATAKYIDNVIL
jgi:putative endonuclease